MVWKKMSQTDFYLIDFPMIRSIRKGLLSNSVILILILKKSLILPDVWAEIEPYKISLRGQEWIFFLM
jgi:hypothetical protein